MPLQNKQLLITGSSGFIGSRLVSALTSQGYSVIGLDVHVPSCKRKGFFFEQCDILDLTNLKHVFLRHSPTAAIHLAARTDLNGEKLSDYAANVEGVRNLINAVAATPSVQRCIYTSSQLVCRVGYVPATEQEYCPNTLYGESKVLTETIVRQHDGGTRGWCLVRPTTVWGPGMQEHYQRFFRMICQGHYFHVGRRQLYKSYGYVDNIVYQYQKLLAAPCDLIHGRTFYLADYEPISLQAWVDLLQKALGAKPVHTIPVALAKIAAFLGDIINCSGIRSFPFNSFRLKNILADYKFDLTDLERICGPLPYTIEHGVNETAAWVRSLNK